MVVANWMRSCSTTGWKRCCKDKSSSNGERQSPLRIQQFGVIVVGTTDVATGCCRFDAGGMESPDRPTTTDWLGKYDKALISPRYSWQQGIMHGGRVSVASYMLYVTCQCLLWMTTCYIARGGPRFTSFLAWIKKFGASPDIADVASDWCKVTSIMHQCSCCWC